MIWLELILIFAVLPLLLSCHIWSCNFWLQQIWLFITKCDDEHVVHHHISIAVLPSFNEVIIACVAQVHLWLLNLLGLRRSRTLACTHSHQADYVSCEGTKLLACSCEILLGFQL